MNQVLGMTMSNESNLSIIDQIPLNKRVELIEKLSDLEAAMLFYDWESWARPEQLPPSWNWFVWLLLAGRGSGKTRAAAEWVRSRVKKGYRRIALIGQTKKEIRDTMVELGESSLLNISAPWERPIYEPSKVRLVYPNGAVASFFSGDEPDEIRGRQFDSAWVDELAKFQYPQEVWDNLELGLRLGKNPQVVVSTTPRSIPLIKKLVADKMCATTVSSTYANRRNLSPLFIKRVMEKYEGTRLGQQELHGIILDDVEGALWTQDLIEKNRVKKAPDLLTRVVIALDPSATSNPDSSCETGIIAAGKDSKGHAYILKDVSLLGTPNQWAARAIEAFASQKADRMIAEANNGGEMISTVIHSLDLSIPIKLVHASRGKLTRAEPISAFYEQGKVHHVGNFPELESQMTTYVPGDASPDRMDALVWALTELLVEDAKWLGVAKASSIR